LNVERAVSTDAADASSEVQHIDIVKRDTVTLEQLKSITNKHDLIARVRC